MPISNLGDRFWYEKDGSGDRKSFDSLLLRHAYADAAFFYLCHAYINPIHFGPYDVTFRSTIAVEAHAARLFHQA